MSAVPIVLQFQIMDMKIHVFILLIILVINADAVDDGKVLKNQAKKKRKRLTYLEVIRRELLLLKIL